MKIYHYLKSKKEPHIIDMKDPDWFALHRQYTEFGGFLIKAEVSDETEGKYSGHGFGILIEEKDIEEFQIALEKMKEVRKDIENQQ